MLAGAETPEIEGRGHDRCVQTGARVKERQLQELVLSPIASRCGDFDNDAGFPWKAFRSFLPCPHAYLPADRAAIGKIKKTFTLSK